MTTNVQLTNQTQARVLWESLQKAKWEKESDGFFIWRKKFPLFDAFVEEFEPKRFVFSLETGHHIGLYEQLLDTTSSLHALDMANQLIYEFVAVGAETLGGFSLALDRPADEIRFIQITSSGGDLFGIDQFGIVYRRQQDLWVQCRMKRAIPD